MHYHGRKHGTIKTDIVLEKELRVLHLDPQAGHLVNPKAKTKASVREEFFPFTQF